VTFTYAAVHEGSDTIIIKCEPGVKAIVPSTPTTTPPPSRPRIFQVELRNCRKLHVGYNFFPAGTAVHWNVTREGRVAASGQFRAIGGEHAFHFLTQPLGVTLPAFPDGAAHFTWVFNGSEVSYVATRAPGC
jgi:hypothetical protein